MTGPENYVEAERLLADSDELLDGDLADAMVRRAQVHATLALTAATTFLADADESAADYIAWRSVTGVES